MHDEALYKSTFTFIFTLPSRSSSYSLNCHGGAMVVIHKLNRIARTSTVRKDDSVWMSNQFHYYCNVYEALCKSASPSDTFPTCHNELHCLMEEARIGVNNLPKAVIRSSARPRV